MCDSVFALGQRGGYHFESPSKWSHGRLPKSLQSLFDEQKIASVYSLALGAGDSFFISYKTAGDGLSRCRSKDLPQALQSFLFEKSSDGYLVRKVDKLQVSLGPYNKSWWATDGTNWKWNDLPTELRKALEERRKPGGGWTNTPRLVTLGVEDNYMMITDGHGGSWNLSCYPDLQSFVQSLVKDKGGGAFENFHNLYLNAYRLNCFIIQGKNGSTVASNLPPLAETGFAIIAEAIKEDTLAKIKREVNEAESTQALQNQMAMLRMRQAQAQAQAAQQQSMAGMLALVNLMNNMNSGW